MPAAIYETMGCRGVLVERERCVERGGHDCFFVTTWDGR
jgi:hypothetical protein